MSPSEDCGAIVGAGLAADGKRLDLNFDVDMSLGDTEDTLDAVGIADGYLDMVLFAEG
jgi:hypothetical protein